MVRNPQIVTISIKPTITKRHRGTPKTMEFPAFLVPKVICTVKLRNIVKKTDFSAIKSHSAIRFRFISNLNTPLSIYSTGSTIHPSFTSDVTPARYFGIFHVVFHFFSNLVRFSLKIFLYSSECSFLKDALLT